MIKEDLILLVLGNHETPTSITKLMKLIFLSQEGAVNLDEEFNFEKSKTGPFSFEVYDSLFMFTSIGLVDQIDEETSATDTFEIEENLPEAGDKGFLDKKYQLTDKGKREIKDIQSNNEQEIKKVVDKYKNNSLRYLLNDIYDNYPETTTNN